MATRSTQVARLNLTLRGPGIKRAALFKAFDDLVLADTRWQRNHALEVESDADEFDDEAIVFSRLAGDDLPAANLLLQLRPYGCSIADIASVDAKSLSSVEYNALVEDFLARIGTPAAARTGFFETEISTVPVRTHLKIRSKGALAELPAPLSNKRRL